MTDLLDDLRDADPVDRASLEVPPALAARVAAHGDRPPHRGRGRAIIAGLAVVVVAMAVIALIRGDSGQGLSLADKAYAATAGPGVRHWRISIRTYIDGKQRGIVQRQEGWAQGGTLHILLYDGRRLTSDFRETP